MSLSVAQLDDLGDDLRRESLVKDTRDNRRWLLEAYLRWCQSWELNAFATATSGRQLVAYLQDAGAAWGSDHRRTVMLTIAQAHMARGLPDPRDQYLRDYQGAHLRCHGRNRQEAAYPLEAGEIVRMITAAQEVTVAEDVDRARAAVIRAAATGGLTWADARGAWPSLLRPSPSSTSVTDDEVALRTPLGLVRVQADRDPLGYAGLRTVLSHHDGVGLLSLDDVQQRDRHLALWTRVRKCWQGARRLPSSIELAAWTDEQWWWQQRLVPRGASVVIRDSAWLLLAWTNAARFADVHDAVVRKRFDSGGWHLQTVQHKTDRDGLRPLNLFAAHQEECGTLCPSCALAEHIDYVALRPDVSPVRPLFATHYAGQWRRMTGANARMQLQSMWERSGGDPAVTVTTRSLRSGAAITASDAGADLEEIAGLLRQGETRSTKHYLRRRRPDALAIHLRY